MRLSPSQQQCIRQVMRHFFGQDAKVWLFGSRADDTRRGGDVDLYVETEPVDSVLTSLRCKLAIEEDLDMRVDLLVNDQGIDKPIYVIAKKTGVRL